jgi:hypothetical protein
MSSIVACRVEAGAAEGARTIARSVMPWKRTPSKSQMAVALGEDALIARRPAPPRGSTCRRCRRGDGRLG